ncbi:class I fructose-bisphosphate aldolase [Shouchella sp. JSM 1781072]|uniref:class I fructose-bisphosphate aldolase n=1 Tax=Shouchella sp. JSM 1781072 TaxID=3344581 RepID=UPI0035C1D732
MTKARRLHQIFAKDGKSLTLALDGYYFSTNTNGIDTVIKQMPQLIENGLDAVLVTYGLAKRYSEWFHDVGLVVRADISTSVYDSSVPNTASLLTVEDALRLGADGIIAMTFPGAHNEADTHQAAWALAKDADQWNLPFICESLPNGYAVTDKNSNDPYVIASAARIAVELGADIVKTRYSGGVDDGVIAEQAQVPVLALGGPKTKDVKAYLSFVKHCMDNGAKGVAVGRNIIQSENPAGLVAALNCLIHEDGEIDYAYQLYRNH